MLSLAVSLLLLGAPGQGKTKPFKVEARHSIRQAGKEIGYTTWFLEYRKDGSSSSSIEGPLTIKGITADLRVSGGNDSKGRPLKSVSTFSTNGVTTKTRTQKYLKDAVVIEEVNRGKRSTKRVPITKNIKLVSAAYDWFWKRTPKVGEVSVSHALGPDDKWELRKTTYMGRETIMQQGKKVRVHVIKDEKGQRSWLDNDGGFYKSEFSIAGVPLLSVRVSYKKTFLGKR